ncbi:3409_t:CDS:2, partial [Rhizophagus irregularis]
ELKDPRTIKSHARNRIIPQRDNLPLTDLITPAKEKVVNELFSDDDSDDTPENDNEREFEDNTSEYSSDASSEACQVNFDAPEIEIEQNYSVQSEELNDNFS